MFGMKPSIERVLSRREMLGAQDGEQAQAAQPDVGAYEVRRATSDLTFDQNWKINRSSRYQNSHLLFQGEFDSGTPNGT